MTQIAIGGMFGSAQPLLLRFPLDRGIFLREYATSTYGALPYFLSKVGVRVGVRVRVKDRVRVRVRIRLRVRAS